MLVNKGVGFRLIAKFGTQGLLRLPQRALPWSAGPSGPGWTP